MPERTTQQVNMEEGPKVEFTLNGDLIHVDAAKAAGTTLNEYIRMDTVKHGTKVSCAQGGCGACTVAIARPDEPLKSCCSCLLPLASVHGAAVVTVEGLSHTDGTAHPVAERLAKFGGSQCGYCTPGMVMQIWSTLQKKDGGKGLKEQEMEQCINANICRCTGYRPIMECAKSFASDTKVKAQIDPNVKVGPYDVAKDPKLVFPPTKDPLSSKWWVQPKTVEQVTALMKDGAVLIAGGTAAGVYADLAIGVNNAQAKVYADITRVQELQTIQTVGESLKIGATVSWTRFTEQIQQMVAKGDPKNARALTELYNRTGTIAGNQVRNIGTIGGNVVITRNRGFLSDWVPPLVALGAKVQGLTPTGSKFDEDLLAFVQEKVPFTGLITSVTMPLPHAKMVFKSFRVADRSKNAHAHINAAFSASLDGSSMSDLKLVLGAIVSKPVRLAQCEQALASLKEEELKTGSQGIAAMLADKAVADIKAANVAHGREQAEKALAGFLVKFVTAAFRASVPKDWLSAEYCLHDMERNTSTYQAYPLPEDVQGPLNKPLVKTTAQEQSTGKAKYTDDVPRPPGTLLAALILCPEANVVVRNLDDSPARHLLKEDFHSVVTAADLNNNSIPSHALFGLDTFGPQNKDEYPVTAPLLLPFGEPSCFGGHPVGILLARGDKPRLMEQAAALISRGLQLQRVGPAVIGSLEGGTEICEPLVLKRKKNAKEVIEQAKNGQGGLTYVTGKFSKKGQWHFYMEPQSCFCVPDEGGISCYSANQYPDLVQRAIAIQTGLKQSKIAVITRRVGGGFGGKLCTPAMLAALSADIALKLRVPVRLTLPREVDMNTTGGRQEMDGTWEVAIDVAKKKIMAVNYDVWIANSVAGVNFQKLIPHNIASAIDGVYAFPSMQVTMHAVKQHVVERTSCRAPGHFEATLLLESIMDGTAQSLNISGTELREANFCQGRFNCSGLEGAALPTGHMDDFCHNALWNMLKEKVKATEREKAVQEFNNSNTFKKRGFAMTPARYGMIVTPGNQAKVDVFKDGSIQVSCSGAEIGQGLHTKVGQMVCTVFQRRLGASPCMENIRFLDTSTEQCPNGLFTGGSTSSEGNMYAAADAVNQLCSRLQPFVSAGKKAKTKNPDGLWYDIVAAAFAQKFLDALTLIPNLSALGQHYGAITELMYETYGVAASEVELDVLTGEHRIRSMHMLFDVGSSHNPMVDIGQMEGAYVMGQGQFQGESMEYDKETGRLLSDNTWEYKPPIASDLPEDFKVELVDMRAHRLNNPVMSCVMASAAVLLGWMGIPWKPIKVPKELKASKAIGEPPICLSKCNHSALSNAMVAALGGPLPNNLLPIPTKPFTVLPLLKKPGEDTTPTGTPTSINMQNA